MLYAALQKKGESEIRQPTANIKKEKKENKDGGERKRMRTERTRCKKEKGKS